MIRLQKTRWVTTFKTMTKFDVFFCSDVNFLDFRDVQVVRLHHPINSRWVFTLPIIIHHHGAVEHDRKWKETNWFEIHPFPLNDDYGRKGKWWSFKMVALKNSTSLLDGWIYQDRMGMGMGSVKHLDLMQNLLSRHLENSSWRWWRLELRICLRKQTSHKRPPQFW